MIFSTRRPVREGDLLGTLFVRTDLNRRLLRRMADLVDYGRSTESCLLMSILGPPRCGKTSLVRGFDQACDRDTDGFRPLKILEAQVPTGATPMHLATNMLRAMMDPAADHGTIHTKTGRVQRLLERGKYDVIVYDEIHRVVE